MAVRMETKRRRGQWAPFGLVDGCPGSQLLTTSSPPVTSNREIPRKKPTNSPTLYICSANNEGH